MLSTTDDDHKAVFYVNNFPPIISVSLYISIGKWLQLEGARAVTTHPVRDNDDAYQS